MKIKILLIAVSILSLTGCDKDSGQKHETKPESIDYKAQFEQSDKKISGYLDKLDNPKTDPIEQKKIICVDWPTTYNDEYAPALIQLQPNEYSKGKLDKELKSAIDYYKQKLNISCE